MRSSNAFGRVAIIVLVNAHDLSTLSDHHIGCIFLTF